MMFLIGQKGKNTSIVCFQETHSSKEVEKLWEDEWGDTCLFSHFNNRSAGVCVMFKKGLDYTVHDSKIDQNGRYIILDISLFDQRLTFVSLYGYNSDEPEMFNEIMKNIASYSNTSYLLCGDWNVVQDTSIDTYNRNQNSREKC